MLATAPRNVKDLADLEKHAGGAVRDILSTPIAPSWDQIGKLGAIVVIRTGLNYFLMREMKEERLKGAGQT